MTYRSRYFTSLQPAPVLDLLMNDEVNPRSLAFQIKDLREHCRFFAESPSGDCWPLAKEVRLEEAAARLFAADVFQLCTPNDEGVREKLEEMLAEVDLALPSFSNAITHAYFSHAELERTT